MISISPNTIVVFTTDNGAEVLSYPDGGNTPFRGEKATNWEGAFRCPSNPSATWVGGTIECDLSAS